MDPAVQTAGFTSVSRLILILFTYFTSLVNQTKLILAGVIRTDWLRLQWKKQASGV